MVNALSIYTSVIRRKIKLVEFKEAVIEGLLQNKSKQSQNSKANEEHILEKTTNIGRCKRCYEMI